MPRNRGKGKVALGEADGLATSSPAVGAPASGGGSSLGKPLQSGFKLLQHDFPAVFKSRFGGSYLTARARAIPQDEVQAVVRNWVFNIKGYTSYGSPSSYPPNYADAINLLTDWYNYKRQLVKAELQYKHVPTALTNTAEFADYLNIAHFAIANCITLLNLNALYQYNQALSTMYTVLPSKASRVIRLYRRLQAVRLPNFIKQHAIQSGMIGYVPGEFPPHVRFWLPVDLVAYGGTTDYLDNTTSVFYGNQPAIVLQDSSKMDAFLSDIEKAVWVLEGNVTYDANMATDITAIRDLLDMMAAIPNSGVTQGLPDEKSFPGLLADRSLLNDWYLRGFQTYSTTGTLTTVFPTYNNAEFMGKIPIMGWGTPGDREVTLLGGTKFYQLNSNSSGLRYAIRSEIAQFGTDRIYGNLSSGQETNVGIYTREDGWVDISAPASFDWNDGSAIRTKLTSGDPLVRHAYFVHGFAGHLTTNIEFRWLQNIRADYQLFVDADDLIENYGLMLAEQLQIPYLR